MFSLKKFVPIYSLLVSIIVVSACGDNPVDSSEDVDPVGEIEWVAIPGGSFLMGNWENAPEGDTNEQPVHTVTLSGFEMSACEITNEQYCVYLNAALASGDIEVTVDVHGKFGSSTGQRYLDLGYGIGQNSCWITFEDGVFRVDEEHARWPVVAITWYGAKAYGLYYGFDLPTEAEWEYACRGGIQGKYGTDEGIINVTKSNYGLFVGCPVEVGSYPANPFGLYDMSGNVWEWCNDWYGNYTDEDAENPTGAHMGSSRVVRGGGWGAYAVDCRASRRPANYPNNRMDSIGYRVVRRPGGIIY